MAKLEADLATDKVLSIGALENKYLDLSLHWPLKTRTLVDATLRSWPPGHRQV